MSEEDGTFNFYTGAGSRRLHGMYCWDLLPVRQVCIHPEAHQLDPNGLFTVLFPLKEANCTIIFFAQNGKEQCILRWESTWCSKNNVSFSLLFII